VKDDSRRTWRDDLGATAVEYGLLVGLIAVVIIGAVLYLGSTIQGQFNEAGDCLSDPAACSSTSPFSGFSQDQQEMQQQLTDIEEQLTELQSQ
jgi:pilus assembly protein Flp/PilA